MGAAGAGNDGRGQLGGERQERIRLQPPRGRAGRSQRAFERPAEAAERGLRGRSRRPGETGGDEHPVVRQRVGRAAFVQRPPSGMGEHLPAAARHVRAGAAATVPGLGPGRERRTETRARPVDCLDRAVFGRGIRERAGERAQRLLVDAGKRRQFEDEAVAPRVDVELARRVPGPPRQQLVQRRRHLRRRPGRQRLRAFHQRHQPPDHGSLQWAGAITTRTQPASR